LAASYGLGEDSRPAQEVKINNISSGGFCFTSKAKLKVGKEVQLAVDLDAGDQVIINVKVAWIKDIPRSREQTIGVQITENSGPDFERFLEYYNKQL